jgi:predicted kinase
VTDKRVLVLCGVSGTGKTHYRKKVLPEYPYVDIADVYKEIPFIQRGTPAVVHLWDRVRKLLQENELVVVEGYFLKGSESRTTIMYYAYRDGVRVKFMNFWAPKDVCEERIRGQILRDEVSKVEGEERIEMMKRCWRKKNE